MAEPEPEQATMVRIAAGETLAGAVAQLARSFRAAGIDTPGLDARRLAEAAIGADALALVREPQRRLTRTEASGLAALAQRRLGREPVSRIIGWRAFRGLDLEIGPATLDPRPDTEVLVDGVLGLVAEGRLAGRSGLHVLDLGTGSGALLVALLAELPDAVGLGIDISEAALAVAARNAKRHGLEARARFRQGNWLAGIDERFDVIVSNPPYIPSAEIAGLEPEVRRFDPPSALDGGADGLNCYRQLAVGLAGVLAPGGWIAVEVGAGQAGAVGEMLASELGRGAGVERQIWRDLGGIERGVALAARD